MLLYLLFMEHKGEIIEQAIRKSGIPISKIAKALKKSRQWVYIMFENPNVPIETILEIQKIIHYDFSNEIKSLKNITQSISNQLKYQHKNTDYWKEKYYKLLEENYELLKKITNKKV